MPPMTTSVSYRVVKGQRSQIEGANTKVKANECTSSACGRKVHGSRSPLMASKLFTANRPDQREPRQGRALDQGRQRNALRWHRKSGYCHDGEACPVRALPALLFCHRLGRTKNQGGLAEWTLCRWVPDSPPNCAASR
jgi:hypothetical protein